MIVIVDYGMGNTGSVMNALKFLGYEAVVSRSPDDFARASHIILPGVGAFPDGMKNLWGAGLIPILTREVIEKKKFFLGICLGMQMLASYGEEAGGAEGLGWIPGRTRKFIVPNHLPLPHVGWNDIVIKKQNPLFINIAKPVFYFVHSYHLVPDDKTVIAATTEYGEPFVAAVQKDNMFGVQFHPEKSQRIGLEILDNFCKI